jgi:hypothetical protein
MTVPVSSEQVLSYVSRERVRTSVRRRRGTGGRPLADLSE